jgi:hypothetical protein
MSLRCLRVFGSRKHHHVRRRGFRLHPPLARRAANGRLFEEAHRRLRDAAHVAFAVGGDCAEDVLGCFFGEVGFFQDALSDTNGID